MRAAHRQAEGAVRVTGKDLGLQARGLAPEDQIGVGRIGRVVDRAARAVILEEEQLIAPRRALGQERAPVVVFRQAHMLPVIQPRPPHGFVGDVEPVGPDQDQFEVERHAGPPDAAGVAGDLGRDQHDLHLRARRLRHSACPRGPAGCAFRSRRRAGAAEFYNAWKTGEQLYEPNDEKIEQYERKNASKKLAALLDNLTK